MKLVKWPTDVDPDQAQHTYHWCPACERLHVLPDSWERRGPDEAPTYAPSFLQYDAKKIGVDDNGRSIRGNCHYIITNGKIQFCPDSWHKRNDVIDMPDVPDAVVARITEEVFKV